MSESQDNTADTNTQDTVQVPTAQRMVIEKPNLEAMTKKQLIAHVMELYGMVESTDAELVDALNTREVLQNRLVDFNRQLVTQKRTLQTQIDLLASDLSRMANLNNYNDMRANVLTDANDILSHALSVYEGETSWDGQTFLCSETPRELATKALTHFSVRAAQ